MVLGSEVHCSFNVKEVLERGRESQIGFGEVHALSQVGDEARIITVGDGIGNSNSLT